MKLRKFSRLGFSGIEIKPGLSEIKHGGYYFKVIANMCDCRVVPLDSEFDLINQWGETYLIQKKSTDNKFLLLVDLYDFQKENSICHVHGDGYSMDNNETVYPVVVVNGPCTVMLIAWNEDPKEKKVWVADYDGCNWKFNGGQIARPIKHN